MIPIFLDLNKDVQSETPKITILYSRIKALFMQLVECYMTKEYLSKTEIIEIQFKNPNYFLKLEDT